MLRSFDVALTIAVALAVGVLGAFDLVGPTVTGGATLATLGLLAMTSLRGRRALANLDHSVRALDHTLTEKTSADDVLDTSTSGGNLELGAAADINLLGVTLARTVRNHHATLGRRLDAGATIRIALIAPHPVTLAEAARRSTLADSPEIFGHRLRPTMDLLKDLAEHAAAGPGRLEVRLLNFVPAFGLVALDPELAHGRVYVDIYSHRSGIAEPTLPLRADRDIRWFRHFVTEFDRVWAAGVPYVPGSPIGCEQGLDGTRPAAITGPQQATNGSFRAARQGPGHLDTDGRRELQPAGQTVMDHHDGAHPVTPGL